MVFKDDAVAIDDTIDDYSYDDNGNMLSDTNKGITAISYNHLNLPTQVTINGENILYIYDATGIKQQKVADGTTTQYAGAYIYENSSLKFASHTEGYIEPDGGGGYDYVYQYKDHLDSVRLVYSDTNNDGVVDNSEILSETNYYPFGLKHRGYNNVVNANANSIVERFKFNGKEFTEVLELNLYDYGSRIYEPTLGRFTSIDPKAEDYKFQSTYTYAANNPVYFQEKDGENPIRAVITAFRIAKRAYKVYKKLKKSGQKFTAKHLKDVGLEEIADIAGDLYTIFDGDTGIGDKIGAVVDLVVGTDFNNKGQKGVRKALGLTDDTKKVGKRRKNRLPDKGEPNTVAKNDAGTTAKKYGPDGNVQKEYNKGHGDKAPKNEQQDHIHDYKPNPNNPTGRGDRQPGRKPKKGELAKDFNIKQENG